MQLCKKNFTSHFVQTDSHPRVENEDVSLRCKAFATLNGLLAVNKQSKKIPSSEVSYSNTGRQTKIIHPKG